MTILFISFFFEGCSILSEKKSDFLESGESTLFEKGKRDYLSSLNFNLDQTKTNLAINELNQFIKEHPDSSKVKEAYDLIQKLLKKIEQKNYYIANYYFIMHKYKAALIYFQDFINQFPKTSFKEKVLYKICVSQYQISRKEDFFKSYNEYIKNFPNSNNAKKLKILYKKLN